MEPRLMIAYALMLLVAVSIAALVAYHLYHSHHRSYERRLRREARAYSEAMRKKGEAPSK